MSAIRTLREKVERLDEGIRNSTEIRRGHLGEADLLQQEIERLEADKVEHLEAIEKLEDGA